MKRMNEEGEMKTTQFESAKNIFTIECKDIILHEYRIEDWTKGRWQY
jgi:hypothetical protein